MVGASGVEPWVPKGFYDGYTSRAGHWYRGRRVDRRNWRVGSHRPCIQGRGGEGVKLLVLYGFLVTVTVRWTSGGP